MRHRVRGDHFTIGPEVRYDLVFSSSFNSIDRIENTDLSNYPDFLSVLGRANFCF